jgi:hypothetical protein
MELVVLIVFGVILLLVDVSALVTGEVLIFVMDVTTAVFVVNGVTVVTLAVDVLIVAAFVFDVDAT